MTAPDAPAPTPTENLDSGNPEVRKPDAGRIQAIGALLKDVLRRYLPDHIVDAPKTGFHVPMKIWLRTHFQDWAKDLLFSDARDPYLDMSYIQRMWDDYATDDQDQLFYPLWCVLMYRQWRQANNWSV